MLEHYTFYRGDSIADDILEISRLNLREEKFLKQYLAEGLFAKSARNGMPFWDDIAYWVAAHVGHTKNSHEEKMYRISPFLSFSTEEKTALAFMDNGKRHDYMECKFFDATHFLWSVKGTKAIQYPYDKTLGIYQFEYYASTNNVDKILLRILSESDVDKLRASVIKAVHQNISVDINPHYALWIDAYTYLSKHTKVQKEHPNLVRNALKNAYSYSEWLLCPFDPMLDGQGFSARFHLNDNLDISGCYKKV